MVLAVGASTAAGLRVRGDQLRAAVRATVQLAAVALVVTTVLRSLAWSLVFVTAMLVVAAATSARRVGCGLRGGVALGAALVLAAGPVVGVALATGTLPLNGPGVVPFAGIVIGGGMTAATLAGRRAVQELERGRPVVEAALALGFTDREAALLVLAPTASEALVPGLDQTRTVGLVTLPGAFVGVLLGGGTAVQAASAQLLVLVGLLAAQAVAAGVVLHLVAGGVLRPATLRRDLASYPRRDPTTEEKT